jgi:hypothetical protein
MLQSNKSNFTPYGPLFYIGGMAPFLGAITLTYLAQGRTVAVSLVKNTLSFTSISALWIIR